MRRSHPLWPRRRIERETGGEPRSTLLRNGEALAVFAVADAIREEITTATPLVVWVTGRQLHGA